jgi:hypothetical protein
VRFVGKRPRLLGNQGLPRPWGRVTLSRTHRANSVPVGRVPEAAAVTQRSPWARFTTRPISTYQIHRNEGPLRFLVAWMCVGAPVVVLVGTTWNTVLRGPVLVVLLLAGVTATCVITRENSRRRREWRERFRNQHHGRHS